MVGDHDLPQPARPLQQPWYRYVERPETIALDPPLTVLAGEMLLWVTDGSKIGRYRKDDAGEWRLVEQRELSS